MQEPAPPLRLRYDELTNASYRLANILIHRPCHATAWAPRDPEFGERVRIFACWYQASSSIRTARHCGAIPYSSSDGSTF